MATLVLTVVGGAIGGPIGAAIGALAGQAIDLQLFRKPGRDGPRLNDLHVQTSSYGSAVPAMFGTLRVAGTVIWATDLKEQSQSGGGGKSGGGGTSYTYSVSLAVALSSRRIGTVRRIWAEGNLLRGAGGDFKSPVGGFRVYDGAPGQTIDPLIAADVGIDQAPAYRDFAYAVFEDLQLADYGNRIPSLTFEIEADAGPITLTSIAGFLAQQDVPYRGDAAEPELAGFAAEGRDGLAAMAPLLDLHDIMLVPQAGGTPLLARGRETAAVLMAAGEAVAADGKAADRLRLERTPIEQVPKALGLRHYDPARDYQAGLQRAERAGPGQATDQIDLPAVLSAAQAGALAEAHLRVRTRARQRLAISHGWPVLCHEPGDIIAVEGFDGRWRIDAIDWTDMVPRLSLTATASQRAATTTAMADAGAALLARDRVQGPTRLLALDLPPLSDALEATPTVWALACGADNSWRWAGVHRLDVTNGTSEPLGIIGRSVLGQVLSPPVATQAHRWDDIASAIIELWDGDAALFPAGDDAIMRGRNLCVMGEELLQFGGVEQIGPRQFRLHRLLRGRRGTEWAMTTHSPLEPFALIDGAAPRVVRASVSEMGATIDLRAMGAGDATPAQASTLVRGQAILPLAPAHGLCSVDPDGSRQLRWIRRSRLGWSWPDGSDAPLAEESERYSLVIGGAGGAVLRRATISQSQWQYATADYAADRAIAHPGPLVAHISQLGTYGVSRPLVIPII